MEIYFYLCKSAYPRTITSIAFPLDRSVSQSMSYRTNVASKILPSENDRDYLANIKNYVRVSVLTSTLIL